MIKSILIKNFILIDELFLEFEKGFNVLTGETGAGKSIIIKAIDTALGAKVSKDVILNNEKSALIEITFLHSEKDLKSLKEFELETETTISREITQSSQKLRVNGALVNLDYIKELRASLIDIHSQNQHYAYVSPKFHIKLLDEYIKSTNNEFKSDIEEFSKDYNEYTKTLKRLEELKNSSTNNLNEIEFLKFQINELNQAEIKENEEEELNLELEKLSNVQELKELSYGAHYALNPDDGILDALSKIKSQISKAAEYDNSLQEVESAFLEGFENLKFTSDTLREYSYNLEGNPQRLDEINERLSLILKLKRKYGDIFEAQEKFEKQLVELEDGNISYEELEIIEQKLKKKTTQLSLKISSIRKEYAKILSKLILDELKELELQKAEFEISVNEKNMDIQGIDNVEFLITTNISRALAPLSKVASGGEISRVMLAIKTVFAKTDSLSCVIFDEIDTGISGKTSNALAQCISKLSNDMQIFAITHQPIIAAKANAHFLIQKSQEDKTKVCAKKLTEEKDRLQAIASLASYEVNEASEALARDLLNIN